MDQLQTKLLDLLAKYAYQFRPEDPFTLASGVKSAEYLDCKRALSQGPAMAALGPVILDRLQRRVEAIGGLTMGSDPIAMSASMASANQDHSIRWFVVRKEPKEHGRMKLIEGDVTAGQNVVVVDDVVTSGKATNKAIKACREAGLNVVQVIVLVDREQNNGLANIEEFAGPKTQVSAVFKKSEIHNRWLEQNQNPTRGAQF